MEQIEFFTIKVVDLGYITESRDSIELEFSKNVSDAKEFDSYGEASKFMDEEHTRDMIPTSIKPGNFIFGIKKYMKI